MRRIASRAAGQLAVGALLCSFYGPAAEANSELLAMGFEVPQNRETMQLQGFNLAGGVGDTVIAPALIKTQWYPKADVPFTIRQQQKYTYSITAVPNSRNCFGRMSNREDIRWQAGWIANRVVLCRVMP